MARSGPSSGEEPILRDSTYGKFDGDYSLFWSQAENRYLIYTRFYTSPTRPAGRRSIGRLTSPDLFNWSRLEPMTFGDDGTIPENQLYINKTQPYYRGELGGKISKTVIPSRYNSQHEETQETQGQHNQCPAALQDVPR